MTRPSRELLGPAKSHPAAVAFPTTEHFTLQGARASTIAESTGRATMFLGSVSGGPIALGLVSTATRLSTAFYAFGLALLPLLAFVGVVKRDHQHRQRPAIADHLRKRQPAHYAIARMRWSAEPLLGRSGPCPWLAKRGPGALSSAETRFGVTGVFDRWAHLQLSQDWEQDGGHRGGQDRGHRGGQDGGHRGGQEGGHRGGQDREQHGGHDREHRGENGPISETTAALLGTTNTAAFGRVDS